MTETQKMTARLDWRTLMSASDDTPQDTIDALDAYFSAFAQPIRRDGDDTKEMLCIECDKPLTGLLSAFLGGGFTWGLAHGEGHCAACHWPARGHHFIKHADGSDLMTVRNLPLQYHPDFVESKAALSKAGAS